MEIKIENKEGIISILTAMIVAIRLGYTPTRISAANYPHDTNINDYEILIRIESPKYNPFMEKYKEGEAANRILEAICREGGLQEVLDPSIFIKLVDTKLTLQNKVDIKKIYDDILDDEGE